MVQFRKLTNDNRVSKEDARRVVLLALCKDSIPHRKMPTVSRVARHMNGISFIQGNGDSI